MDVDEYLPSSEADLLAVLLNLPYQKRIGYAPKLVNNFRNDPALLSLIQELLSTSLLPDRVPFPGREEDDGYITLLFPQSNASKRFFQREFGLAMASALGKPAIPILLDAIIHPSTAGKSHAITACASGATDEQLVEIYHKSVPATQEGLRAAMVAANRVEALKLLQLWKEPSPAAIIEPKCVALQRDLKLAKPLERDKIWTSAGLSGIRPHRRMHDPLYVPQGIEVDLVTTLFDLLELYPPPHKTHISDNKQDVPSIPSSLDGRIYSFLKCDISRALRLVRRTCYIPDSKHKQRNKLRLPSSFMHQRSSVRFWHMMSLESQQEYLLPFILELMHVGNQVLLKNGELQSADLLPCARWQIIIAVANSALAILENERTVHAMSLSDRKGIVSFVVYGIDTLASRLYRIAHREDAPMSRLSIERELGNLLHHAVERVLTTFRVSAQSDEAFVKLFTQDFITPLLCGPLKQYPPLIEVLFDNVKGLFDIAQVSKSELHSTACQFLRALKRKKLSVFDIPDGGVVQPYCGIANTDNDAVFRLLLRLTHPRDDPFLYIGVCDALSAQQKEVIWGYFDDIGYISGQVRDNESLRLGSRVLGILRLASPRTRLPFVMALLDHPNVDDVAASSALYSLLDVSDPLSREMLYKNTYKRLFTDRRRAYHCLVSATMEQRSVKESIATMKFLISRIKNEILPDAETLSNLFGADSGLRVFQRATVDEARELADLCLAWEKQNNEAVSQVSFISQHIASLATFALSYFAGFPAHPAFHFGMDLLWAREVYQKGPMEAYKTYDIRISMVESSLSEDEELKRRQFILMSKDLGETGFWRISDEQQFVDTLLEQYHKVHQIEPFEKSTIYHTFISSMLDLLGVRWTKVSALREYTEHQLDVLRSIAGSGEMPADWTREAEQRAVRHILHLHEMYRDAKRTSETLSWWSEFRHLRLFSTDCSKEVDLLLRETFEDDGKQNQERLDKLVEKLLSVDDSAVYLEFVRSHVMNNRQDLLKNSHITSALVGVFNQLPDGSTPQPPPWQFDSSRRLYPHQCELFAVKLLETIHSGVVSLQSQVEAAEKLTQLPTTTIIELAELLKENPNQRIIEAILMFLPRLDEPASGIQFLLSLTYLDSDLARTAIFSVRNSLKHVPAGSVPKVLIPVFPPENSKKLLKITVMKELVRLVCQHISHEEHQTFLMTLWKRKLHQDVRIALIQSVIPFLGSKQGNLAWTILRDAVSNPGLALDDALFALLAVRLDPSAENDFVDDDIEVESIIDPEILTDMAHSPIPSSCHDLYAENVLYPLSQLCFIPETFPDLAQKEAKLLRERMYQLQRSAYHVIFSVFLKNSNAHIFAQIGLDAAKRVAFSNVQGTDLFPYFVFGIGRCVTLDPQCWQILCQLVDFLANAVGNPKREPTQTSLKAVQRLRAMKLGSNMTFQRPESIRMQLSVDRMTLLEPLTRYGCDHFSMVLWERRFHLFSCERRRASSEVVSSELQEARNLLLDLIRLSEALQLDLAQLKSKATSLVKTASTPVADTLVDDLLSGNHGLDGIWINELRLVLLTDRIKSTIGYGRSLSTFLTQIANYDKPFYVRHWTAINELIVSTLKWTPEQKVPKSLVAILLDPMFERVDYSAWDLHCLDILLAKIPDVIINHRPQWVVERVSTKLSSLQPWETTSGSLWPVVQFVKSVNATRVLARHNDDSCSDLSPLTALLIEAIYSGNLRNFNLERVITSAQQADPVLLYPYFVTDQDDGSGGDIESRQSKATVPQLLQRYQEWKTTHASQYLAGIHPPQAFPSALILQEILEYFPQLALVHPLLFLSYAAVTFGQSDLGTNTKIHRVLSLLKNALKPDRRLERGTRWGWAPPLSLTLSFARILFTETANEVAETVLDDHADVGSQTCKLAAVELLLWWIETFYGATGSDLGQLVEKMARGEGEEALLREYRALRSLACGDECRAVREKAFVLP